MTVSGGCCECDTDGDVRENEEEEGSRTEEVVEEKGGTAAVVADTAGRGGWCGDETAGTSELSDVLLLLDDSI